MFSGCDDNRIREFNFLCFIRAVTNGVIGNILSCINDLKVGKNLVI
ncbi:hypothetical protein BH10ACI2_BH10ACI2_25260 [soil metagenome]